MSSLTLFSFESHSVRAFNIDGTPWFVGKDVAEVLGYKDAVNAIKLHCKGVAKYHPLSTAGGTQDVRILNEPDTFRLVVNSKLPEAERFERWLFEEVLPSIRQTGGYALPGASASMVAAIADLRAQLEMIQKLARWAEPMLADLEVQVGRATAPAIRSNSYRPRPPRRAAPLDPWEPQIRAYADRRLEVTSAEVLRHLGIEDGDQTQNHKTRIAKLLNQLGFVNSMVKRNGRVTRIWQRHHHA